MLKLCYDLRLFSIKFIAVFLWCCYYLVLLLLFCDVVIVLLHCVGVLNQLQLSWVVDDNMLWLSCANLAHCQQLCRHTILNSLNQNNYSNLLFYVQYVLCNLLCIMYIVQCS